MRWNEGEVSLAPGGRVELIPDQDHNSGFTIVLQIPAGKPLREDRLSLPNTAEDGGTHTDNPTDSHCKHFMNQRFQRYFLNLHPRSSDAKKP